MGSGKQDLATHVPALLLRGKLVLEVDSRGAGFDHGLHQLEDVESATEPGLGIGDDGCEPVGAVPALGMVDLVSPLQSLVYSPNNVRHAVGRVQTLVWVHVPRQVG